jgi:hypothetical protein
MKKRGRDVLIGVPVGAVLIIWITSTHHKTNGSSGSHPRTSASASASHSPTRHAAKAPAPKQHTHAAASHHAAPAASTHPTPLTHSATRLASAGKPADSGLGNGVIAIAALVAIAASLSTVTLTVHHMRGGSMRGETR